MHARGSQVLSARPAAGQGLPLQREEAPCFPNILFQPPFRASLPVPALLEAERHFGNSLLLASPVFPLPSLSLTPRKPSASPPRR